MDTYQSVDSFGQPMQQSSQDLRGFLPLTIISQVVGVAAVVMVAVWMGVFFGGMSWEEKPFFFHPLFMIIGMVFLYGEAILVYRVFRHNRKLSIKILHGCLHVAALVFAIVGVRAVFKAHEKNTGPAASNMYSLHSWIGMFTIVCYCVQWVIGFLAFLFPRFPEDVRVKVMHFHLVLGHMLLALVGATVLMGITELNSNDKVKYQLFSGSQMYGNCLGLVVVLFIVLVMYIVNNREYRRVEPLEEERIQLKE